MSAVSSAASGAKGATVAGLITGAAGIGVLWATGVVFPFYPPPGLVILAAGAVYVALSKWRWAPGVGAFLGLFVIGGFVLSSIVSGEGIGNLSGEAGLGPSVGTAIQLTGVTVALVAGALALAKARHRA